MSDFFADQESQVQVDFPQDGVTVWLRKYVTAGIQEAIANESVRVQLQGSQRNGQAKEDVREGYIRAGNFHLLQQMIVRVDVPEGITKPNIPVSNGFLGRLKPEAIRKLLDVIEEHNPLSREAQEEAETTTG